ncbi:ABC transporter permease [Actinoplanes sp. NEAU-A12]|uniref:ABC transporter permease n=1 Tax=Actinoplanes sandaracinus TaxID=3045177 RepID=A0ABT6WHE7_9ACTN|nr:ABC transporter permease [Actinoplanes sandaracinus]MDI6099144.1 ABC transporter permease [Actinoplanes sandaracinus]
MNLVRSELAKIRTTNVWWILILIGVPLWAAAIWSAWLADPADAGTTTEVLGETITAPSTPEIVANFYTSGQYIGLFFVFLLGVLLMTNEVQHNTATATFLFTPRRTAVVAAKIAAAALVGVLWWAAGTVVNIAVGAVFLADRWGGAHLDDPTVWAGIALNGVAFALWAVFGVGLGVLIRSQIGASLAAAAIYFIGPLAATFGLFLLVKVAGEGAKTIMDFLPYGATAAVTGGSDSMPYWLAALVLLGYGAVTSLLGTTLIRRRDIA